MNPTKNKIKERYEFLSEKKKIIISIDILLKVLLPSDSRNWNGMLGLGAEAPGALLPY